MMWRRPLWPVLGVAVVLALMSLPSVEVEYGIFIVTAVSVVVVVMQVVRAVRGPGTRRHGQAPAPGPSVPPRFVDSPVSMLWPVDGSETIIDPTTAPGWVDDAVDQGANVRADWDGPEATGIRYTASAWYPLNVFRVNTWQQRPGMPLPDPPRRSPPRAR